MTEPLTDEELARMRTMFVPDSIWARLLDEHAAQQRKLFAIEEAATPLRQFNARDDVPRRQSVRLVAELLSAIDAPPTVNTRWDARIKRLEARIDTAVDVLRGHNNIPLKWAAERVVELVRSPDSDKAKWFKALDALAKATDEA